MRKRNIKIYAFLLSVLFVLPVFSYAEEVKDVSGTAVQKAATEGLEEGYMYDPKGRRDPFLPLVEISPKGTGDKKIPRILGTLESYDIPDFKLKAIIEKGKGEYYGLLIAPDNKSFVVKQGTVIGLNNGKVTEMYKDKIVVVERITDYKGELIPRKVVLELYEGGVK